MKFRFISEHNSKFGVKQICRVLGVSRSGYYTWQKRGTSQREQENQLLLEEIRDAYEMSRGIYGSPRITHELKAQGVNCSENRVARLMKQNGIRSKARRRFKVTTNSRHQLPVAPNLISQNFSAKRPNEIWFSDITYVWTREGWLYLAVILDCFSRKIVGWSMSSHLTQQLVINAFKQAVGRRQTKPGSIFHSDRGTQYAGSDFKKLLNKFQFIQSMSRKGNCYDNAITESFFSSLKTELIYQQCFFTKQQAKTSIFEYIEVFYNKIRRHSSIDYKSPYEFEKKYLKHLTLCSLF